MWHGLHEVDKEAWQDLPFLSRDEKINFSPINVSEIDEDLNIELLDLLHAGFEINDGEKSSVGDENESIQAVLGEGFAKVLLLSEKYPSIPASLHPLLLAKLINLYFRNESEDLQRLKQCLSIFFEHYASLSSSHKECLSKAFVPVMRSMWPGINGNAAGSSLMVSNKRKRAVQASKFMLQMMQAPLYAKQKEVEGENGSRESSETVDGKQPSLECGEEGLAIRLAVEVVSFQTKKTPAERSYISALCRILVLLHFRLSEQGAIKLMRRLLNHVLESVSAEKDLVRELKRMAERLKGLEKRPDEELSQDVANTIFGRLDLDFNLDVGAPVAVPQTPVPCSNRPTRRRRRMKHEETYSDEECSPTSAPTLPNIPGATGTRSQRASKTAAMTKMTAKKAPVKIDEEEISEVTSDEDSDESDEFTE